MTGSSQSAAISNGELAIPHGVIKHAYYETV
jgi:hypothetical protein